MAFSLESMRVAKRPKLRADARARPAVPPKPAAARAAPPPAAVTPAAPARPVRAAPAAARSAPAYVHEWYLRWGLDAPLRRMQVAILASVLVHAVLMAVHFVPAVRKPLNSVAPPLEVVLVNSRTESKPVQADALAQANLDGGGNTDAKARARTPLPVSPTDVPRPEVVLETRRVEELEREAQRLMAQLKAQTAVETTESKPAPTTERVDAPSAAELMKRSLEIARLEAQIHKDMSAYQQRPKRRFIGARTQEFRFARYVEDWRAKIERVGTLNFPEAARNQQVFGSLQLTVSIRADGSVDAVELNRSSGKKVLDDAAMRIVKLAAPFSAFPPDIAADTDILSITRTWTFTRADQFVSE